jgi:hypothetical protein
MNSSPRNQLASCSHTIGSGLRYSTRVRGTAIGSYDPPAKNCRGAKPTRTSE